MGLKSNFLLLARYNQSFNQQIYDAAAKLDNRGLTMDRGAFFGSIIGTLNHILVADVLWLKRFAKIERAEALFTRSKEQPQPNTLDEILYGDFAELYKHRQGIDCEIIDFISGVDDSLLSAPFTYTNSKGTQFTKRLASVLLHFFNHQTHHRGQVTTLLSQEGINVGITDLLVMIPNEA